MTTIICVAVRMKSKRCPEKAIKQLWDRPLILQLNKRLKKATLADDIVWCTSTDRQDDILEDLAKKNNINYFRGSRLDVMSRFLTVAKIYKADTIVRVTGDNPLTCPELIDRMIASHLGKHKPQYTYTNDAPRGIKPEIINVKALKDLHSKINCDESEYMTTQLKQMIRFQNNYKSDIGYEHRTLTVDTPEDLKRMQQIYNYFQGKPDSINKIFHFLNNFTKGERYHEFQ